MLKGGYNVVKAGLQGEDLKAVYGRANGLSYSFIELVKFTQESGFLLTF